MEHILQIGINVDDEAIKRGIEEQAEQKIIKEIKQQVANKLFQSSGYGRRNVDPERDQLSEFSKNIVEEWLNKYKNEIITEAAKVIAEKMMRSKIIKEKIAGEIPEGDKRD